MIDLPKIEGFWYLATPYSKYPKGQMWAFVDAAKLAGKLLQRGVPLFCPIVHSHPIAIHGGIDGLDHDFWIPADRPMMDAAGGLLVGKLEGWEDSDGICEEINIFNAAMKQVEFIDPNDC